MIFFLPLFAMADCEDFSTWKKSFREAQKQIGISEDILKKTIDDAIFQPKIIRNDRNQAEFTLSFEAYLQKMHSPLRVDKAIKKYKELKPELDRLEETYGVAGEYLIAFWAIETNFGQYQGKIRTKDALSTLACDTRRSSFFSEEYSIFIRLVSGNKLPANAHSSWAGAMGHLQFLPNKIEKYARDGDEDGHIDIFSNRKDAFETAANYLSQEGWKKGETWGQSVRLSQNLATKGRKDKREQKEWEALGVEPLEGQSFARKEEEKSAIISLKTGENFMVYDNFDVIMIWNHSSHYALAVGLLADKIINAHLSE